MKQKSFGSRQINPFSSSLLVLCLALGGGMTMGFSQATMAMPITQQLPDFSTMAEQASPAIVNISTMGNTKRDQPQMEDVPEILRRYFGLDIPDNWNSTPRQRRPQYLGSGFIISKDGYVLTNNHVIEDAQEIIVRLNDRSEYKATLVGADEESDLALLKVDGKNLPTVKIGSSETLKPGQWVFAIGSPFGFDYSVTKGIISALNRSLPSENYVPFIQTDVPINPGNSGGPLLNMSGEVVGINSQIYTRSGGFMGLSFAIPIDEAMNVARQLREHGQVTRSWLGVIIQDVDRNLAESFGLDRPHGALVSQVLPDSPAQKGGLESGDIITRFNGQDIKFSSNLPIAVGHVPVGKEVAVEIIRRGKVKQLKLAVGAQPDNATGEDRRNSNRTDNRLGIAVGTLDEAARTRLRLDKNLQGVVIANVGSGVGRAYGLRRDDVITDINHQPIKSTGDFYKIMAALPNDRTISMRLVRRGIPGFITFRLNK